MNSQQGIAAALQQEHSPEQLVPEQPMRTNVLDSANRDTWCQMVTAAVLRLVASDAPAEDVV